MSWFNPRHGGVGKIGGGVRTGYGGKETILGPKEKKGKGKTQDGKLRDYQRNGEKSVDAD